jgi:hypothetical protein
MSRCRPGRRTTLPIMVSGGRGRIPRPRKGGHRAGPDRTGRTGPLSQGRVSRRPVSGRAAAGRAQPLARAALRFGDLAGGHVFGHVGAGAGGVCVAGKRSQIEPFVRLDQIVADPLRVGREGRARSK